MKGNSQKIEHWRKPDSKTWEEEFDADDRAKFKGAHKSRLPDSKLCGVYAVRDLYEAVQERKVEDCFDDLLGLYELLRYNPKFSEETEALCKVIEGFDFLDEFKAKVDAI